MMVVMMPANLLAALAIRIRALRRRLELRRDVGPELVERRLRRIQITGLHGAEQRREIRADWTRGAGGTGRSVHGRRRGLIALERLERGLRARHVAGLDRAQERREVAAKGVGLA